MIAGQREKLRFRALGRGKATRVWHTADPRRFVEVLVAWSLLVEVVNSGVLLLPWWHLLSGNGGWGAPPAAQRGAPMVAMAGDSAMVLVVAAATLVSMEAWLSRQRLWFV